MEREVPRRRSTANSRFLSAAIIAKAISKITSASTQIATMSMVTVFEIPARLSDTSVSMLFVLTALHLRVWPWILLLTWLISQPSLTFT